MLNATLWAKKEITVTLLALGLAIPTTGFADDLSAGRGERYGVAELLPEREVGGLAHSAAVRRAIESAVSSRLTFEQRLPPLRHPYSSPRLHPVLLGAVAGAGLGVVAALTFCPGRQSEGDCTAWGMIPIGAAVGATGGLVFWLLRR